MKSCKNWAWRCFNSKKPSLGQFLKRGLRNLEICRVFQQEQYNNKPVGETNGALFSQHFSSSRLDISSWKRTLHGAIRIWIRIPLLFEVIHLLGTQYGNMLQIFAQGVPNFHRPNFVFRRVSPGITENFGALTKRQTTTIPVSNSIKLPQKSHGCSYPPFPHGQLDYRSLGPSLLI